MILSGRICRFHKGFLSFPPWDPRETRPAVSHACQMSKLKQIIRRLHDILLVPRHRRGRRPWFSRSHRQMCRLISLPPPLPFSSSLPSPFTSSLVLRLEAWRAFNRESREQKFHSRFHFETVSIAPSSRLSLLDFSFFFNNLVEIYRRSHFTRQAEDRWVKVLQEQG